MKELMFLKELTLTSQTNQRMCMICHYWYFKDICHKYEPYVCNGRHDLSMVIYNLKDFIILNIKDVDYRCYMFNMCKNDAIILLNNSWLDNKGIL